MEADFDKHKVENYYDLFTGMFCQPGAPSYSTFTVDGNKITVNSYKVPKGKSPELFNTFYIKRTKDHSFQKSGKKNALKIMQNGLVYIIHDNITYNSIGQIVSNGKIADNR